MPGLAAIVSTRGADEAARRFGLVRGRMLRHARMRAESVSVFGGTGVLGRVSLHRSDPELHPTADRTDSAINTAEKKSVDRSSSIAVAYFHGVLHNERSLRQQVGQSRRVQSLGDLLSVLYTQHGPSFVDRLEGEFCLALVDPDRERVLVATDAVGSYPVYWRLDADGLIFSSDLSALLSATPSASRLDLRAVADYLTIGAVLGAKTLVNDVHQLDPGTVLTYDVREARASLRPYLQLETFFHDKVSSKSDYLDAVSAAFKTAVGRALEGTRPVGLSLSGGLDSRAILSAANGRSETLRTYTLGVEGCADQVIAKRLAGIARTHHDYFRLDSTYLRDFLPNMARMVSITDGMYLSHGLTEMLALQFLDQTGIEVLLRGHGGELAKAHLAWPLHTDQRVYELNSLDELVPYLSARANYITPDLPLSQFLMPSAFASAGEGTRETFATILKGTALSPADCCSYLYLRELSRRFTVPSLELFRTRVEVRLPYLDSAFLKVLLRAPSEWRDSTEIHRRLTATGLRQLLRVRNSNTGARADAGPWGEFILDKCNTALKRLNVRGYRHYHDFDGWMRSSLLESVEAELLMASARVQTFVPKTALRELIRETRDRSADRSYLLQVLLILELWQRENGIDDAA